MTAHDSGWKWWLAFSFLPDFHRLHWHQLAWRTQRRSGHSRTPGSGPSARRPVPYAAAGRREGVKSGGGVNAARSERDGPGHRQHGRRTEIQSVTFRSIARTSRGPTTMALSPIRRRHCEVSDSSIRVRCGDGPCRLRAIPSGRALRCNLRSAPIFASIPIASTRWRSLRAPLAGPAPETRVSIPEPSRASVPIANKCIPLDVMAHCPTRARCANPQGVLLSATLRSGLGSQGYGASRLGAARNATEAPRSLRSLVRPHHSRPSPRQALRPRWLCCARVGQINHHVRRLSPHNEP